MRTSIDFFLVIIKQKGIPAFINVILIHWIIIRLFDLFISSFQNVHAPDTFSLNDRPQFNSYFAILFIWFFHCILFELLSLLEIELFIVQIRPVHHPFESLLNICIFNSICRRFFIISSGFNHFDLLFHFIRKRAHSAF